MGVRIFFQKKPAKDYFDVVSQEAHSCTIFAADSKDDCAAKKYIVGGWKAMWKHVKRFTSSGKGYFYEMLQPNTPLRVYYDFDADADDVDRATFEANVARVVEATLRLFNTQVSAEVEPDAPVVLDASYATKHSQHLVFPNLVLRNMEHMQRFVSLVREDVGEQIFDPAVYNKDRVFRVIGSRKRNKPNAVPLQGDEGTVLTPTIFFGSLVSAFRTREHGDEVLDALPLLGKVCEVKESTKRRLPQQVGRGGKRRQGEFHHATPNDGEAQLMHAFATKFFKDQTPWSRGHVTTNPYNQHRIHEWAVHGLPCPKHGGPHKSNMTGFSLNLTTMDGHFFCWDPDCERHKWGHGNFKHVIDPEAFRYKQVNIPKKWFRPLEAFAKTLTYGKRNVRIITFKYNPRMGEFGQLSVVCHVDPVPCKKHSHAKWHNTTFLITLGPRSIHKGVWRCSNYPSPHILKRVKDVQIRLPRRCPT